MKSLPRAIGAFAGSSIGKKILVALTGLVLLIFLAGHLAGNLLIYRDPREINAYAYELRHLLHGAFIWVFRAGILLCAVVHVYLTIVLRAENRAARGAPYVRKETVQATLASRSMLFSGVVILSFVVYHLLHFTVRSLNPEFQYLHYDLDGQQVHDVYKMVIIGFQNPWVSAAYIVSIGLLSLHLSHGFASLFQTLGLRSQRTKFVLQAVGLLYAAVIFLGNVSIPVSILAKLGPFAKF